MGFWTEERIARLKLLWAGGYSATRVSQELGCTRNAVVGKIDRLKLVNPPIKQAIIRDGVYVNRLTPQTLESRKIQQQIRRERYRSQKRAAFVQRQFYVVEKEEVREQFRARGASPYSAAYRKHYPRAPEMTKSELREMLAIAMQNTAAL